VQETVDRLLLSLTSFLAEYGQASTQDPQAMQFSSPGQAIATLQKLQF
jgi:hypothetical protein